MSDDRQKLLEECQELIRHAQPLPEPEYWRLMHLAASQALLYVTGDILRDAPPNRLWMSTLNKLRSAIDRHNYCVAIKAPGSEQGRYASCTLTLDDSLDWGVLSGGEA